MHPFAEKLLNWHDMRGRKNLPWQEEISPYRVWISEIMLQQTQVTTVIPYFNRFITAFPTVRKLAVASLDQVLHLWTGLGYYARARNLHKSAQIIADVYQGKFPNNLTTLVALPGIGRSTAGAILSIAFQIATPILDGNVKRVLTRYHAIEGYPGNKNVETTLWRFAETYTPQQRCATYTQAIMDLGAMICTRSQPQCKQCPLQSSCSAYHQGRSCDFPTSKPKNILPIRSSCFVIFQNEQQEIFLVNRPLTGIWGGLWSFPELDETDINAYCQRRGLKVLNTQKAEIFRHTFSHFHLDITPIYINVQATRRYLGEDNTRWYLPQNLPAIGLAAPVKKLLLGAIDYFTTLY